MKKFAALGIILSLLALNSYAAPVITAQQKLTIEQLTSVFENATTDFLYAYMEDIQDGGGVTCGRVGFNTSAGDLLQVIQAYTAKKKSESVTTPLAQYIPCLTKIVNTPNYACLYPDVSSAMMNTDDFRETGLSESDFGKYFVAAAKDIDMRNAQDEFVDKNIYDPAVQAAKQFSLKSALGLAMTYDALVQMGDVSDMGKAAQADFAKAHNGRIAPETDAEEIEWLKYYEAQRRVDLDRTPIGATTTGRVDSLDQILAAGNLSLKLPFTIIYDNNPFTME